MEVEPVNSIRNETNDGLYVQVSIICIGTIGSALTIAAIATNTRPTDIFCRTLEGMRSGVVVVDIVRFSMRR